MIATSEKVTIVFPDYNIGHLLANDYKMLGKLKVPTPFCLVCTVVMKYLHGAIKNKSNQVHILFNLEINLMSCVQIINFNF